MSRDFKDIPEAFRRAFENDWIEGERADDGGDQGGNGRRPPPTGYNGGWWQDRRVWIGGVILFIFLTFNWAVTTYTEWLWFGELGYQSVWLTRWGLQIGSFLIFFLLAALLLWGNWRLAIRRAAQQQQAAGLRPLQIPGLTILITMASLFLAFIFGLAGSSQWERLLRYFYRLDFGVADPIFNRDISFFLFELPMFRFVQGWLMPIFFMAALGTVAIYALGQTQAIQRGQWRPYQLPALRQHAAALLAVFFGLWAVGYWLDIYELVYAPGNVVFGATYIDINAVMIALQIQLTLMALIAIIAAVNIFRLALRPLLVTGGLWLAATILVAGVYPGLVQRFSVDPNELALETPYIEHNIAFTRLGYGLHEVRVQPFGNTTELTRQDISDNELAMQNIRLWDYRPLLQTYGQLQALRPYYQFNDIDIDRYGIEGQVRQVMLSPRELEKTRLPGQTWVNRKLEFTHGYGVAMNPVDRVTRDGQPDFFIRDLPPRSNIDLEVTRPEIYYGELTIDQVYVASGLPEFSYPSDEGAVYAHYAGSGGLPVQNWLRRALFAIRFGDTNLVLSQYIDNDTRIMYHREIRDRVKRVAPFLQLDNDPYIVIADGRMVWMIDTYTVSGDFPYSTPVSTTAIGRFNYIRNAVKVTVDAYDGTVKLYIADEDDPIIQTYARAFPDLFKPLSEMPESLFVHIRYPEDLFKVQTFQYLTYHMTNVQVFYNREDLRAIPVEMFDQTQQPMEPYYVLFRLPGEPEAEYLLIQPFVPANRDNMVAWIAARNDPPHYGELVAYELPRQELVFGPIQVEARIDQDPFISQQFSLWSQRGSRVIRGNLIVIPLNQSFLYVEPIYLQAETSALPELRRVILVSGERVVMRDNLAQALVALVEDQPVVEAIIAEPPVQGLPPVEEGDDVVIIPPLPAAPLDASVEELIAAANRHFEAAETAQRQGDWATYGRELEALGRTLDQLLGLANEP